MAVEEEWPGEVTLRTFNFRDESLASARAREKDPQISIIESSDFPGDARILTLIYPESYLITPHELTSPAVTKAG